MQPIPVESWLDRVQESICEGNAAEDTGPGKDASGLGESGASPTPLQTHNDDANSRSRTAHQLAFDLTAPIPQQSPAGYDHDPVGELRHAHSTLVPLREQEQHERPWVDCISVTPEPSDCSSPVKCDEEFARRPRRKTRQDRYDPKTKSGSDKAESHHRDDHQRRAGRKARRKNELRSAKEVVTNFTSESIRRDHLMMKPGIAGNDHDRDIHARKRGVGTKQAGTTCCPGWRDTRDSRGVDKGVQVELSCDTTMAQTKASAYRSDVPYHLSLGRYHLYEPVSHNGSSQLKHWPMIPAPVAVCDTRSRNGAAPYLEPLDQNLTRHESDQWTASPYEENLTTLGPVARDTARRDAAQWAKQGHGVSGPREGAYTTLEPLAQNLTHNDVSEWAKQPKGAEGPYGEISTTLDPAAQDMTWCDAAQSAKRRHGALGPHDEISTTLELAAKRSRPWEPRGLSLSNRCTAEKPLHHPIQNTAPFDTKAQQKKQDYPVLSALRSDRYSTTTLKAQNTASEHGIGPYMDLGGGHYLDFGRLRDRGLPRAERVPRASPVQPTRQTAFPRLQRQVNPSRKRAGRFYDEGGDDRPRRRSSRRPSRVS
ncbi:uncharacterized protein CPUR_08835 [Claviceps purpurea 20.1]|uniref:Uncharacterized protein n=1 Tax=Claviceps purpurea (strain 20.1) TaxID=1111077 RepID=M1W6W0_CLAP2|nr:uncharacterized protein CPUR_08835 [Claviceps purpurea 20.1]